uniref:Protein FAR1-RELATED SEQUENCE n=1 Tax=Lactuca sativa TaxID=4236 RepID=A0A9R1VHP1_LACSA|nr:hypothetical protein LSAT_V11C500289750 [Lactuca sativa]
MKATKEHEDFKTMNSRSVLSSVHPIVAKVVSITCSCVKYETNGILSQHSMYVMKKKHVKELPSHYILPRWTLNARYKPGSSIIGLGEMNNENGVSANTLWFVHSNFTKLIEQARDCPSEIQKVNTLLISLLDDQTNRKKSMSLRLHIKVLVWEESKIASRIRSSLEAPKNVHALTIKDWVIMLLVFPKERQMNRWKRHNDKICCFCEQRKI